MEQKDTEELFKRIQEGTASKEEINLFEQWYLQYETAPQQYSEQELNRIKQEMSLYLPVKVKRQSYQLWSRISIAASIILVLGIGIWFFVFQYDRHPNVVWVTGDIPSGKNSATLTLANGKTIILSDTRTAIVIGDADLKYNDGSKVQVSSGTQSLGPQKGGQSITGPVGDPSLYSKNSALNYGTWLSAATPRGGTYQIILPDGTHVWLNADSKISFPSQFSGKERRVILEGEAYFEVAKAYIPLQTANLSLKAHKKRQSFIVATAQQEIEVLGTHFNVNAYKNEPGTKTTLLEGSVKLSGLNSSNPVSQILSPGQEALFTDKGFKVSQADLQSAISWKNGEFIFNDEPLESVLRKVSRWYNVDIIYQGSVPRDFAIGGFVSRKQPVSVILQTIAKTEKVSFRIEGRKIFVSPLKQ